jgi:hypothetical protein
MVFGIVLMVLRSFGSQPFNGFPAGRLKQPEGPRPF